MSPILPPTPENLAAAAAALKAGELVAFPTETVYGLGADAGNDRAVAEIFAAKGRPRFNPLIVHVRNAAAAERLVQFDRRAKTLAERFWPGSLTLVLPRRDQAPVSLLVSAGLDTLALRVPRHPVAEALLAAVGRPLAAPSANRSGKVSPTTAQHVADSLGERVAMILDGGRCPVGIESTVLDLTSEPPTILRPGAVTQDDIAAVIGPVAALPPGATTSGPALSPGLGEKHYAPDRPLRLDALDARPGEALLAFGPLPAGRTATANLSPSGDLTEAAANLFAMLRDLDRAPFPAIAVMPVPEHGLGRAINDRLRRAAAR
jgi:L-threonylcarbamoyladenylate synthase